MPAPDKASTAATDKAADKPDTGEATTSTSATDASTTEGRAAALGADKPAGQSPPATEHKPADDVTRVVVEQPAPEPAVLYGEDAQQPAPRDHVRADYKPFGW